MMNKINLRHKIGETKTSNLLLMRHRFISDHVLLHLLCHIRVCIHHLIAVDTSDVVL